MAAPLYQGWVQGKNLHLEAKGGHMVCRACRTSYEVWRGQIRVLTPAPTREPENPSPATRSTMLTAPDWGDDETQALIEEMESLRRSVPPGRSQTEE